jgi:hypothetical protein
MSAHHSVWITWEKQVRNRSLSDQLDAQLVELDFPGNAFARYFKSIAISITVLWGFRKKYVFVQNPSVVLSLLACIFKPIFKYTLIIDAHNISLFPQHRFSALAYIPFRIADLTLISNDALAIRVSQLGGNPQILPDPLPELFNQDSSAISVLDKKKVVFICSWANDEPYFEVFKAAELLPELMIYITGKSKGKEQLYPGVLAKNIYLTGYLADDQYHQLLLESVAIIDLTTRENCLVCGAYEATSIEKPFVVSDTKAIRAYFSQGCIYVDNTAQSIAEGVRKQISDYSLLQKEVTELKQMLTQSWKMKKNELLQNLRK